MRVDGQAGVVGVGDLAFHVRCRLGRDDQVVLEGRQSVAHQLQRVAADRHRLVAGGEVHRLHDPLDDAPAVVGVHNVEARAQAGDLRFRPELAGAEAVERADPVRCRAVAQQLANAGRHLPRGLVGEGHGENARGGHAAHLDPVRHAGCESLGLAGARAGKGEHGARQGGGGGLLGRQPGQQVTGSRHCNPSLGKELAVDRR